MAETIIDGSVNQATLDLVKRFEGLSLTCYLCPAMVWTIGYGAIRDLAGAKVSSHTAAITKSQANDLLQRDLTQAARQVDIFVQIPLSDNQRGALISFVYNLGPTRFRSSTLRKRINTGDWDDVPDQMLRWVYGGGKKLAGLERRRKAEALLWLEG